MRTRRVPTPLSMGAGLCALLAAGCGTPEGDTSGDDAGSGMETTATSSDPGANGMIELLEAGQVVFGLFSGEQSEAEGRAMAENTEVDFVFYSLESGPFDLDAMSRYIDGLSAATEGHPPPIALRIPPIRDDREAAADRTRRGLAAGAVSIVYPHVESAGDVALATEAVGDRLWPVNPEGDVLNVLLIEDVHAVDRADEIVSAAGAGVVIPGPGDLRRAYEGDMEAVEGAIQKVLASCLEFDVACGITAGADDVAARIEQGFRFFIMTDPAAVAVGRAAAGRDE